MADNLPSLAVLPDDPEQRERLYLALLNLAPEFRIPCRPGGALRDITVSRHRNGPDAPWKWAVHRLGAGMSSYAWHGTQWWVVYDRARMREHAVWDNPLEAIYAAQRIAVADAERGCTEVEYFTD